MKFFGEYLVENKIIDEETLLAALVQQVHSLPSYIEVVHENKFLSCKDSLAVLALQTREQLDFKEACTKLGLWTSDLEAKLEKILNERRKPLGHILYSEGKLSLQDLIKSFDEFISVHAKEKGATSEVVKPATPAETKPATVELSPAGPFNPAMAAISSETLDCYLQVLNDSKKQELEQQIERFTDDDLHEVSKTLYMLKGTARFIKAEVSEKLAEISQILVEKFVSNKAAGAGPGDAQVKPLLKATLETMWLLREGLQMSSSEKLIWDSQNTQIQQLLSDLSKTQSLTSERAA